ncbi:hypothetical protein J4Q44_G00334760 [Coregonus suidteri]|uniref:Uncharacterized protein n=1 Tax=Coregonus suidteri TaxID=861788 RepID=A0AAN8KPX3_9TELE
MASPGIPMAVSPLTPTTALSLGPYANDDNNNPSGGANPRRHHLRYRILQPQHGQHRLLQRPARNSWGLSQDGRTLILSGADAQRDASVAVPHPGAAAAVPREPCWSTAGRTEEEEQGKECHSPAESY